MAAVATVEDPTWSSEILELYEENFDQLVHIARRSTRREDLAEEVVQEAFIKFCTADCRPSPGKELAYLRTMVINGARSTVRREARRVELVDQIPAPPPVPNVEETVAMQAASDAAQDAIARLPARQRLVLGLRYVAGLSERETAEVVGVAPGTVKIHASRGREAARAQIALMHGNIFS